MEYLYTERAHLMCPGMSFGITAEVSAPFDEKRIKDSFAVLAQAHPFLKALLGHDRRSNAYYYDITEISKTELIIKKKMLADLEDAEILREFERLTGYEWNLFNEGMLKASAWKIGETGERTGFLLVFHHLLTDGRGALGLAQELAEYYARGKKPEYAPERLISAENTFPDKNRMPLISRMLVNKANSDWKREKHDPPDYSRYRDFAGEYIKSNKPFHALSRRSREEVEAMTFSCRENGITVNDLLIAQMMTEEGADKIIIASDLRSRLPGYNSGSLGNYSTAFSIEIKKKHKDIYELAKAIHKKVQKTLNDPAALYLILNCYESLEPPLLDASFISVRGCYNSKAAKFIGTMFFGFASPSGHSITNLGKTESVSMTKAYFIPPASPAIKKTLGILTVNGEMTICTSERLHIQMGATGDKERGFHIDSPKQKY